MTELRNISEYVTQDAKGYWFAVVAIMESGDEDAKVKQEFERGPFMTKKRAQAELVVLLAKLSDGTLS